MVAMLRRLRGGRARRRSAVLTADRGRGIGRQDGAPAPGRLGGVDRTDRHDPHRGPGSLIAPPLSRAVRHCRRRPARRESRDADGMPGGRVSGAVEPRDTCDSSFSDGAACSTTPLCALAVGALAADVERLWLALSRLLPPPWRAEALVLLGFSAYVRGDGPLAGVALDAALMAQADHRLGQLLMSALLSGMRPDEIGTLADTGYRIAHELGISLPPRQIRRAG